MKSRALLPLALMLPIASLIPSESYAASPKEAYVFVGTYTGAKSKGIYLHRLNLESGALSEAQLVAETPSPSFLAIHPSQRFLYAANEVGTFNNKPSGAVTAFSIDPKSGQLTQLNQQASEGSGPCHLVVDRTGRNVLVANYGAGSVAVLPTQLDGRLSPASAAIQHKGSSANPQRQEAPHAHSINLDASNQFAVVADLGLDQVLVYKFEPVKGSLVPNSPAFTALKPGAGPRHFSFHPSGKFGYVINELHSSVTSFSYNANQGTLTELQTLSTIPGPVPPGNSTAEVQVHPSGKFLYGSNRGHNSIAIYQIDPAKGTLSHVGNESTRGKTPRNFGIDPSGKFLLAANQDSDSISVFAIHPSSGKLSPIGEPIPSPMPVCIKFLPRR